MPIPNAASFTPAPLQQRMRVALDAPVAAVWALIGDLARMPEYSAGLERVDVRKDTAGVPLEYVCHFRPEQEGAEGITTHAEPISWYEPQRGWASAGPDTPDAFGMRNSFHRVTLGPSPGGTEVDWIVHYRADDPDALEAYRKSLDLALADIAERLVGRFGGKVLERVARVTQAAGVA